MIGFGLPGSANPAALSLSLIVASFAPAPRTVKYCARGHSTLSLTT